VPVPAESTSLLELPGMADDLGRVDDELRRVVASDDPFLTEVARHLIDAGGKRVRPALTITASLATAPEPGPAIQEAVRGGVAVELVHQGSLYHDDVIDGADTRRTVQSVNARFGNLEAILAGDYLLARASEIAADLGTEVAGLLASTIAGLCEGQVRELASNYDVDRTEAAYLESIGGKTAVLLATAARIGGIVADLPRDHVDALTGFGHAYGMAFQVVDDVLDLTATDGQLGKPAGNDLCEGVYTLPVIRTLAGPAGEELRHLLGGPIDEDARDRALAIVRADPSLADSMATAVAYTTEAGDLLDQLPSTPAVATLRQTCDLLLARVDAAAAG
tara:strand:+ start:3759 stop:4763 length:1005 start_codon:yes stop_codon:yes gene_type:complete